jgi:hypothetical protein
MYPGLLTPDLQFIQLCLESYSVQDPLNPHQWHIRPEDNLSARELDIEQANRFIRQMGERLGYVCEDRLDLSSRSYISWVEKDINLEYRFFTTTSAAIGEIVLYGEQPPDKGFIVIPGSRANLLIYKMRRDPRYNKAFNPLHGNWKFLKFRHLRSLAESPILGRENLDQLLALDPITYSTPQIWLL